MANKPIAISYAVLLSTVMVRGVTKAITIVWTLTGCSVSAPIGRGSLYGTRQIHRNEGRAYVLCAAETCPQPTRKTSIVGSGLEYEVTLTNAPVKTRPAQEATTRADFDSSGLLWTAHFSVGSASLSNEDKERLIEQVGRIGDQRVVVRGYTDGLGGRRVNLWLARERARVVSGLLQTNGIPVGQIELESYPECCGIQRGLPLDRVISPARRKAELVILNPRKDTS